MNESTATANAGRARDRRHAIGRSVHPFLIVLVALLIAGAAFFGDLDVALAPGTDAAILKLIGGALLLVLVSVFFEQQMQIWRDRRERSRHLDRAHDELTRMRDAMIKQAGGKA